MKQLGTSKLDDMNRARIPKDVMEYLSKGDRISWELDEKTGNICIFLGNEHFDHSNTISKQKITSENVRNVDCGEEPQQRDEKP